MSKLAIPEDVLEKLRCSLCKDYLYHPPIYSYPDQSVVCGRCPVSTDKNPIRNVSYEAVVKYLFFPCRYRTNGCFEEIILVDMQEHEETCLYKQYACPFIPLGSCPWQGPSHKLLFRYKKQHNGLALNYASFKFNLLRHSNYEKNYVLKWNDELFVVQVIRQPSNKLLFGVHYIGNKKKAAQYMFAIYIKDLQGHNLFRHSKQSVDCDTSMNFNKNNAVCVHANTIIRHTFVVCTIGISTNNKDLISGSEDTILVNNDISSDDVDEDLLREIECPVCNEYMVPPIHQCIVGHSICGTCKSKVTICPLCEHKIAITRNFSLEKVTKFIKYYCKYREIGCCFVSASDKIRNHELHCKFIPYKCPFKSYAYDSCGWLGKLSDLTSHVTAEHTHNTKLNGEIIIWLNEEGWKYLKTDDLFLITAHGEIFKLFFRYENQTFYWSMQLVGPAEDAVKYMFVLDFVDTSDSEQRLFLKFNCTPLVVNDDDAFTDDGAFVQISYSLMRRLIHLQILQYKCYVVEKSIN